MLGRGPVDQPTVPTASERNHKFVTRFDCPKTISSPHGDGLGGSGSVLWRGLSAAVALFRSLGDATRLAVVQELASGERRIVDLTARLGLAQSTVSRMWRVCAIAGWLSIGRWAASRCTG